MKTVLVFPPQAHPTQPALCLPSLVAYLRQQGLEDTHQMDLNLEAHEYYLSADRLAISEQRVQQAFAELPRQRSLSLAEMDRFRILSEAVASSPAVVEGIEDALATIRNPERFYDYDQYLAAVKMLDRGFRLLSAEFYPSTLTPHNFTCRYSIEREEEILAAVHDPAANLFVEFFQERAVPQLLAQDPDLVGISLTYTSQVIPGLALARLLKEVRPDLHITVGGGLLAYIGDKMTRSGKVFDVIDSVIVLEGEGPLLELARCVAEDRSLDSVGNCIHRRAGQVITNAPESPLSIDDLPTPVFDGLPMNRYLAPKLALPLAITRGCYWEKCAFCTLYKVIGPGYRERHLDRVMDDIEEVTSRWGSNVIYFIVEDMPPPVFKALPDALQRRGLDIRWWTDARLERNLFDPELCRRLAESGCRRIAFGFESASQRLLDLMEKGTSLDEADGIVRNLADAGISITLYTMIGFPTETQEEARQTLQWLRDHKDVVHEVSLRIFYIDHLSKVYEHPENYQVRRILDDPEKDLQVYYDWEPGVGMSRRQARELFFDFMKVIREEFPLFRGDNLQLFELKSHYFLYLDRFGDLSFLERKHSVAVGEEVPAALDEVLPRIAAGNRLLELPYDLRQVSTALNEAECSVLRPRYMSGTFKEDLFRQLQHEVPAAQPCSRYVVYRARSADLLHLGKDAARLFALADGSRSVAEMLAAYPQAQQGRLRSFFAGLLRQGLWTSSSTEETVAVDQVTREQAAAAAPGGGDWQVRKTEEPARAAESLHLYCKPSST
jgi:hypothetical protein